MAELRNHLRHDEHLVAMFMVSGPRDLVVAATGRLVPGWYPGPEPNAAGYQSVTFAVDLRSLIGEPNARRLEPSRGLAVWDRQSPSRRVNRGPNLQRRARGRRRSGSDLNDLEQVG